ncbi:twin-arginine translocase subunit TatC [Chloroflexota bacterium]
MSNGINKLSVLGHFSELRKRLVRSLIAVAVSVIISFIFYPQIFEILLVPAPPGINLQAVKMTEMLGTTMRVALISGLILAMPYLTYELIMFVSPALTRREKNVYISGAPLDSADVCRWRCFCLLHHNTPDNGILD